MHVVPRVIWLFDGRRHRWWPLAAVGRHVQLFYGESALRAASTSSSVSGRQQVTEENQTNRNFVSDISDKYTGKISLCENFVLKPGLQILYLMCNIPMYSSNESRRSC